MEEENKLFSPSPEEASENEGNTDAQDNRENASQNALKSPYIPKTPSPKPETVPVYIPEQHSHGKIIALVLILSVITSTLSGAFGAFLMNKTLVKETGTGAETTTEVNQQFTDTAPLTDIYESQPEVTYQQQTPEATTVDLFTPEEETPQSGTAMSKGDLYAMAVNSIVSVKATWNEYYNSIFGSYYQPVTSKGTGFIITEDGYILTNYHVVQGGETITVTDYDGNEFKAVLVGSEPSNDIALLKIDANKTPVVLGNSSDLKVGDDIMVIGNALGELSYTFTDGIVSHLSRQVSVESGKSINMFQTNAAINNGNSGGPVYNMYGEVVGIASAKYASESIEGLGFCIPIDNVKAMISDIINYGYVTGRACLDITLQTITSEMASRYSIPEGCYVVALDKGGAASNAGIQSKDVITELGDEKVSSCEDVARILNSYNAGDTISITYYRNGKYETRTTTLSEYTLKNPRTSYSDVYDY